MNYRIWIYFNVIFQFGHVISQTSKVYDLIYKNIDVDSYDKCVRLLNGTHQVGCQSSQEGNVGVLFHANTSDAVENFFSVASKRNYVLLVEASFFNRSLIRRLKTFIQVKGVIVYAPENFNAPNWSPDLKCPTERIGLYNASRGPEYANCKKPWNFMGDGLTEEDIPFPVFYTDNATAREPLLECYNKHNQPPETFPLCAVEMRSWMHGAVDAISCIRKGKVQSTITQVGFCDVMGGRNMISSLKQFTDTYQGKTNSTILVTAPFDSRSFMASYTAPGANEATALVTLMGVAYALGQLAKAEKEGLEQNIVFVLFDAEAFDNIGSTRMVYDMKNGNFPVFRDSTRVQPPPLGFTNISAVLELGQLGFAENNVFAHYDPVSYEGNTKAQIDSMINLLKSSSALNVSRQSSNIGLAPSSLHSILVENDKIPGVVLSDYDESFENKRYFSRYDNLNNLNITWNENATDEEMLDQFKDLAQRLSTISTAVAQSLHRLASSNSSQSSSVAVQPDMMAQLLFCFLYKPNCSLFQQHLNFFSQNYLAETPYSRYVSVYGNTHPITNVTISVLAAFTGENENNFTTCHNPRKNDDTLVYLYEKGANNTPVCVISSSYITDAYPQYFLLENYADYANFPGMWAESQWATDSFRLRLFLIQEEVTQGMTLLAGLLVSLSSFIIVWRLNKKASSIFVLDAQI